MLSEPYYHKRLRKQKLIRAHILLQEHPAAGNSEKAHPPTLVGGSFGKSKRPFMLVFMFPNFVTS